jgi:hydrogenase maturation protein HypF
MTSGNVSDEPIAIGNDEARLRLARVADAFLLHDREIVARYDDSVLRVADSGPVMLRRARGYAPMPLTLPVGTEDAILAVGPHLKNTFTLAQGTDAFVSQHIGDLDSLESQEHFADARRRFELLFNLEPRRVVRDLHPGYLSTDIAERSGLEELQPVQHHHAHIAAVLGEHGVTDPVLGLAFDGTGYGTDGKVWGCELLLADLLDFRRMAHLRYAPLPGADEAVRTPWRSLLGYASLPPLREGHSDDGEVSPEAQREEDVLPPWVADALAAVDPEELRVATRQIQRSLNTPDASSLGRLFDAAAALLGIRRVNAYEGQAAMELEASAGDAEGRVLAFPVRSDGPDGVPVLDPVPLLTALADGLRSGRSVSELAADFHETVAVATAGLAAALCAEVDVGVVALGGGCFQNVRLLDAVARRLEEAGLDVLLPQELSPNDGAVSYGQAVVAAARLAAHPETGADGPDPTSSTMN